MTPFDHPVSAWRHLRHPVGLTLAIAVLWFLCESLVFRSGFYFRNLVEPHSNAGTTALDLRLARRSATVEPPSVLVFGDSRVGQGFSPEVAGKAAPFNFINVAIPGSRARAWFYLLRAIERHRVSFDVVLIGMVYPDMGGSVSADWPLDPAFMAPLVDLRDAVSFPASFDDPQMQARAREAIWFPTLLMQKDIQAMLAAPLERRRSLRGKRWWLDNIAHYPGRGGTMPELSFDARHEVLDWDGANAEQREAVEQHLRTLAQAPPPQNAIYLEHWLGEILALVRRRGAHLMFYPLPRGPYPQILPHPQSLPPALARLAQERDVTVLPPDFLADLEAPSYFFDALHGNIPARTITSERVAHALHDALARAAPVAPGTASR